MWDKACAQAIWSRLARGEMSTQASLERNPVGPIQ
jgi:hypothetical protein